MRLYHGTPNLARVLKAGVVRPSDKPEPLPDLTATLAAYRRLLARWEQIWPNPTEPWRELDPGGFGDWLDAAIIPMQGFAYATTDWTLAQRYASRRRAQPDPGVVLVEADPAKLLPDEDWIGCVAASAFTDCADCDQDIRGDLAAYDAWAAELPGLVSAPVQEEIAAELYFIQDEIDWDTFCTLPLQAVIGRTVIRDVGRAQRGLAWLRAGLAFADRFAHRGPLRVIAAIDPAAPTGLGGLRGPGGASNRTLRLTDLGVIVHPAHMWPNVGLSYGTRSIRPTYPIEFHTTQDRVSADLVATKMRALRAGEDFAVEVVKVGGRVWVIDGHHTLAAYICEGLRPVLAVHGGGPYSVSAPRYVPKRP